MGKQPKGKIVMIVMCAIFSLACIMEVAKPFVNYLLIANMKFPKDPETETYVNSIFDMIQDKNWEAIRKSFVTVPEVDDKGLARVKEFFQDRGITERKLVNHYTHKSSTLATSEKEKHETKTVELLYAVKFSGEDGVVLLRTYEKDKVINLHTLNMQPLPKPYLQLVKENSGIFSAKNLVVSMFMILYTLLLIYTEYDYFKIAKPPRKWLQILLSVAVYYEFWAFDAGASFGKGIDFISFPFRINAGSLASQGYRISIPFILILYWVYFRGRTKRKQAAPVETDDSGVTEE